MPVEIPYPVDCMTQKTFNTLDYQVMKHAFDLYNSIGNLWDENDYRDKLHGLCNEHRISAHKEVPVKVSFKDYSKTYFIDLLVEGAVYELKTTVGISPRHKSQTLNYIFLTNTRHGKIINFRPDSLQWEFVSTQLTNEQRGRFFMNTENWQPDNENPTQLPDIVHALLHEWGAFLDLHLYKEAMLHFMNISLDYPNERFYRISDGTLLHFTCLNRKTMAYKNNLDKYLRTSDSRKIEWINFNRNQIELHTLSKK